MLAKRVFCWVLFVVVIAMISACSTGGDDESVINGEGVNALANNDDDNNQQQAQPEPSEEVTLLINRGEDSFDFWEDEVQNQFPHIDIEWVDSYGDDLEEVIASGQMPDIITHFDVSSIPQMIEDGYLADMSELIEQTNFDLNSVDQEALSGMYAYSEDDGIYGFPASLPSFALHYNKDVFDRFGVSYPTDGMTWNEVIDVARTLTAEEEGVQYRGLNAVYSDVYLRGQMGLKSLDPETDEPLFETDPAFQYIVETINNIMSIPGNWPEGEERENWLGNAQSFFVGDMAMMATYNLIPQLASNEDIVFEWDIVSFPVPETPYQQAVSGNTNRWVGLSAVSEHKEAAFDVLQFVLSEEMQRQQVRENLVLTSLSNKDINQEYGVGEDFEELMQTINLDALWHHPIATAPESQSRYDGLASDVFRTFPALLLEGGRDINTILRELSEEATIQVEEAKTFE